MNRRSNGKGIIIAGGVFIAIVVIFTLVMFMGRNEKEAIMNEYTALVDTNHVFESISFEELKEKYDSDGTFYLYIGYPECPACQNQIGYINDYAESNGVSTVYYLNYRKLTSEKSLYLQSVYNLDGTPTLSYVENGMVVLTTPNMRSSYPNNAEGMYRDFYTLAAGQ